MAVLIKNPSVEVCALPFPLKGLLKGGQDVIINCTYAALIAACPSITNLHVENLGDSYAGDTDAGTFDLVQALTNSGDSTIDGALNVGGAAAVTGNATLGGTLGVTGNTTLGGTLGVTGDISAAGGFRQCIQFGDANIAAGDNATPASATPVALHWCGVAALSVGWVAPRAGSFTALSAALSTAAAGSNLIVGVYVNGTIVNAAAIITLASGTSDTSARTTWAKDTYAFAAGDVIDVRIRAGSGWTATAADIGVALEVEC